ncbi:MAG: galactokinase, partial [Clostridia bacterium]|nr:galactokinase [Clostridia bacterium]
MDYSLFYGENADEKLIEKRIRDLFEQFYNAEGVYPEKIFSSPGRAEILGNHTDHNCGKVIVAAISCDILAAVKKTNDGKIKIISEGFSPVSADLSDLKFVEGEIGTSAALCKGVANALKEKNLPIGGFTAHFTSSVFKGAGV